MIEIEPGLSIPDDEVTFVFSRSGGPGGQHVNKVSTRATLLFDLRASSALTDAQKTLVRERLATRVNRDGILRVVCATDRSQASNRAAAIQRFATLLRGALRREKPRTPTRVSAAERSRRLEEKRRRARLKRGRRSGADGE